MRPIRRGMNPVKIPFPIKSSDPTLAAWCNEVRTAILNLEARSPTFQAALMTGRNTQPASGIWGTFVWDFTDAAGSIHTYMTLKFENGLLVEADNYPTELGDGTEADPYEFYHTTFNTDT